MARKNKRQPKKIYKTKKNRVIASILAGVFGIFGVHHFYLQKNGLGIFFIMMFIVFVNAGQFPFTLIFGLIAFLQLIFMSDEEFDDKYNGGLEESFHEKKRNRRNVVKQRARKDKTVRTSSRAKRNNPFKSSGEKKYEDFDIDGAIADFEEGLRVTPDDGELHFMLAKAYSLNENADKSYFHITKAIDYGNNVQDRVLSDDDFAFLRIDPKFVSFKENGYKKIPQAFSKKEEIKDDVLLNQLNKLAELKKRGLLSENEFLAEKEKLMRR